MNIYAYTYTDTLIYLRRSKLSSEFRLDIIEGIQVQFKNRVKGLLACVCMCVCVYANLYFDCDYIIYTYKTSELHIKE